MKLKDLVFAFVVVVVIVPFIVCNVATQWFMGATAAHPYIMAFFKFVVLATIGDMLGLRIKQGVYNMPGYGLAARGFYWGLFGVWIAFSMKAFAAGVPAMLDSFGIEGVGEAMREPLSAKRILGGFVTSVMFNTLFGTVFMTTHKITDTHILNNGGGFSSIFKPIPVREILKGLNWDVQWGFVLKKTVPIFWIPAHTITFLLPPNVQVLFAAALGIMIGVILSIAAILSRR